MLAFVGRFLVDTYKAMSTIGCSITLTTNHRAESQCIVDNACRISEQIFPISDPARNFHIILLPDSKSEASLSNGWFTCMWHNNLFEMFLYDLT